MPLPAGRQVQRWVLHPPTDPANQFKPWSESASVGLLLEEIRRHAEVASIGKAKFSGTRKNRSDLWYEYRNYLRQAISNFESALKVPNRSACLLYYYAMLNFAKAELMQAQQRSFIGQRLAHGLSFQPVRAKSVAADYLTVTNGVFPMLYAKRTGKPLAVNTKKPERLPIGRLLSCIPELGTQTEDASMKTLYSYGFYHLLATDGQNCWTLLLLPENPTIPSLDLDTQRILDRHFRSIAVPPSWRDMFAVSRRFNGLVSVLESKATVPALPNGIINYQATMGITWAIRDILSLRHDETYDAYISPSLYRSKSLRMPHSLARYAATYYASSLVRYKPMVFDSEFHPEQAHLFDSLARECALPMLIDVLSELAGSDQLFFAASSIRC